MKPDAHAAGATRTDQRTPANASGVQRRAAARGELRMNCGNAGKTADRGAGTAERGEETADELRMLDEAHSPLSPLHAAAAAGRRAGRSASPADRAGADLAAADPALPLELPSVPQREAVPAAPLHSRGERGPDDASPALGRELPVHEQAVIDAALSILARRLREPGAVFDAAALLRAIAGWCDVSRGPEGGAAVQPLPLPEKPRTAPPAAPWSLNLTRGDAQRWPDVWAQWLPQWIEGAAALGVAHREHIDCDAFSGLRHSLLALGIVRDGDFPGDSGRGRSMVTFAYDGLPKRKGDAVRLPALRVSKSGGRFFVRVFAPDDVVDERRLRAGFPIFRDGQWVRAPAPLTTVPDVPHADCPPLRLVHSRLPAAGASPWKAGDA